MASRSTAMLSASRNFGIVEQLVLDRIGAGDVGHHRDVLATLGNFDLVAALGLVLLVEREVGRRHEARLHVDLALDDHQVHRLLVLEHLALDLVDVGQLVASLVDRPEVGIALHDDGVGRRRRHHAIGGDHRVIRIQPPGLDRALLAPEVDPALDALVGGDLGQFVGAHILGVILLHVVGRHQEGGAIEARLARAVLGDDFGEQRVGLSEGYREGLGILDGDDKRLAIGHQRRGNVRRQFGIEEHVLIPEAHVVGGHRLAIRPLEPLEQREGELGRVVVDGIGLNEARLQNRLAVDVLHELDDPLLHQLGRAPAVADALVGAMQRAAVSADLAENIHNLRLFRQALVDRRQLARLNEVVEHRRLIEGQSG